MSAVRREEEREDELRVPEERADVVADEQVEDLHLFAREARCEQRATRVHCEANRVARRGARGRTRARARCAPAAGTGSGGGCGARGGTARTRRTQRGSAAIRSGGRAQRRETERPRGGRAISGGRGHTPGLLGGPQKQDWYRGRVLRRSGWY